MLIVRLSDVPVIAELIRNEGITGTGLFGSEGHQGGIGKPCKGNRS